MKFFYQGWKKGGNKDFAREDISEEDPLTWLYSKYNIFPRSRQGCLEEKLLKNLGMTQHIIIERELLFLSDYVAAV